MCFYWQKILIGIKLGKSDQAGPDMTLVTSIFRANLNRWINFLCHNYKTWIYWHLVYFLLAFLLKFSFWHWQQTFALTLSRRRSLPYRNQSIDLLCKSMDWFLNGKDLRHERANYGTFSNFILHCTLMPTFHFLAVSFTLDTSGIYTNDLLYLVSCFL